MTKSTETFYIASFECREVKAFDGKVITSEGTIGWLGESEGYPAVYTDKSQAKHFVKPQTPELAAQWNGMPWYYQGKPGTLKNYKVTITTEYTRVEEEVL